MPAVDENNPLIGKTVRTVNGQVGTVIMVIEHEPQAKVQWTDDNGELAENWFEVSAVEEIA